MSRTSSFLSEKVVEAAKASLREHGKDGMIGRKLQAIISAFELGIGKVADVFGVTEKTLTSWIKKFSASGSPGLLHRPRRKKLPLLTIEEKAEVGNWLMKNSSLTIMEVMQKIKDKFGKVVGRTRTYYIMRECGMSYQTARPRHYKADAEKQVEFKKNYKKR